MNPRKWKVNLNHCIFMLYKSSNLSPSFITMQGNKYPHICNLWGKFLPAGMNCTTTDTISIYTRGWDALTRKNVLFTHSYVFHSHGCNKFLHAWTFFTPANTTSILMFAIYLRARMFRTILTPYIFYSYGCNVRAWNLFSASVAKPVLWQLMILLPCTLSSVFYLLPCLLFPWVQ